MELCGKLSDQYLCLRVGLVSLFFSFILAANAQYVTIPDSSFAEWLNENYSACMVSGKLDTTCTAIRNVKHVSVSGKHIATLHGIKYFRSLDTLLCRLNDMTSLPELPPYLTFLNCESNKLKELQHLPFSIKVLHCSDNQLSSLPVLPGALQSLVCYANKLTFLPALPKGLRVLECYKNKLTKLPSLPNSLERISCHENLLTSLPDLPISLTYLNCRGNKLSYLPDLPVLMFQLECSENKLSSLPTLSKSMLYLICSRNELEKLPALPGKLLILDCDRNKLRHLPVLPGGLMELMCDKNELATLPSLPSFRLSKLKCSNNRLDCLPLFPQTLINKLNFDVSGNSFKCVLNYVEAMDSITRTYPVCVLSDTVNNPKGCTQNGISGFADISIQGMDIYPNPGNGIYCLYTSAFNIDEDTRMEIYNELGLLVISTCVQDGNNTLDISNQPMGIYTLRVKGKDSTWCKKIVKQ